MKTQNHPSPSQKRTVKRRVILVLVIVVVLVFAVTGIKLYTSKNDAILSGKSSSHSIVVDGVTRTYRLYEPASLPETNVPLVIMLHGTLGTGEQAEATYGWNAKADAEKFAVVYPDGLNRSWAVSESCCGPSAKNGINDVGFIQELVETVSDQLPIDANRVYAAGISNGGMMAYRLACETNLFAAIGPDAATMLDDCPSPRPTSIIHIHGTADQTVPYTGGPGKRDNGGQGDRPADTNGPSIPALLERWHAIDACDAPVVTVAENVTTSAARCANGRNVTLITIDGAGHQWPGAQPAQSRASRLLKLDTPSTALNATDTMWRFFSKHQKSGR